MLFASVIIVSAGILYFLPWWSFALPLLVLGGVLQKKEWQLPMFVVGFSAGFLIWGGMELFYATALHDVVLHRMAALFSLPSTLMIPGAGLIGGLVSGLALYAGKALVAPRTWNAYTE